MIIKYYFSGISASIILDGVAHKYAQSTTSTWTGKRGSGMKLPGRRQFPHLAAGIASLVLLVLTAFGAGAQATRTIRIVVPYAAGGGVDLLSRLLAEQIGRSQGVTMVVENRPGASTVIGTEAVARAAPDGNTLLMTQPAFVINAHLRRQNYDPLTGFEPICNLVEFPVVLVVNSDSPYRTLVDLLNAARARPGNLTVASLPASWMQLAFEKQKHTAQVDMTFVPYPGSAPQVTALLGGHVTAAFAAYPVFADHLKSGKLRALASNSRIEAFPEVLTFAEAGFADLAVAAWTGLFAPAKTPKETVLRLANWFTAAMAIPEVKTKLTAQELYPVGMCGSDFAALLRKQYDSFGRIIHEANIKTE
jgi:tripartite-type tricarboxylate transporter receptor subunit TctC